MIIRNCDCGKKVDCGCTVSFNSYEANSTTVLSVGDLVGGSCAFDAYVIDWYVDGKRKLVSGKGNDPEIQAYHPFEGSAAIPVEGGLWTPVIRYVVINGERIYNGIRKCDYWCEDLTGLPSINVAPLGCGIRNLSVYDIYDYRISYNTSQDFALASRTVRFDLPHDLSAVNFAFSFTAYDVADRVDFYLNESEEPFLSWIIGTRGVTNWYQSMPYRRNVSSHKIAFKLPEYQAGDYLIIKVTPSVLEQNTNTNWMLDMKCLDSSYVFACDHATIGMKTIDSLEMVHDEASCRYQLKLNFQQAFGNWNQSVHPFWWMYRYGGYGGLGHNGGQIDNVLGVGTVNLSYSKTIQSRVWTITGYATWTDTYGAIHISKAGNVVTIVCEDSRDYQLFYDNYQYLQRTELFTDYSPDPLSVKHYRYVQMNTRMAPLGCGDAYTARTITFHVTSTVVFSGGDTMTITMQNVAHGYPDEPCNNAHSVINTQINSIQSSINLADFSGITYCRPIAPVGYSAGYISIANNPVVNATGGNSISAQGNITVPCTSMPLFCDWTTPNNFWLFTFFYVRVIITAEMDENKDFLEDPRENFEVHSMLAEDGCYTNTIQRLLYKKVNGVEVTNILPAY